MHVALKYAINPHLYIGLTADLRSQDNLCKTALKSALGGLIGEGGSINQSIKRECQKSDVNPIDFKVADETSNYR